MHKLDVKWRERARLELLSIIAYIAQHNISRADRFYMELIAKADLLSEHPYLGRTGQTPGTRELVLHRNYIAIYRIYPEKISILRLKHAAKQSP